MNIIGDIQRTRLWLSVNRRPLRWSRWLLSFGGTYNGTIGGVVLATPFFVLIGHVRSKEGVYRGETNIH